MPTSCGTPAKGAAGYLNPEPFAAALGDLDGGEFAALDLVQDGLAGDAERLGGLVERQPAVGDVGHEAGAGLVGSAGSRPSRSQRRIVDVETPSSLAACSIVTI